ncbi:NAD-dependent epimerase/dehydratase family protein [Citrifermentans bremense]|uniref:NAD-dependent epimerase/dehydratase family protein n=1 Tax=Citrifermentans bremense TaxID=60035 RepID=UPI000A01DE0D|nr:NAD-dependent epimerase/dehydratase family protein [Citrifermentans bremense]
MSILQGNNGYKTSTLVIGGAGFIGAHLIPMLVATGRVVTVLDRAKPVLQGLPGDAKYVVGDFGHKDLISDLLDQHQEVIHLAYATVPNTSFENPLADLLQNLPPSVQLFSEIAERGGKLILVSSGGTVYGEANESPIREDYPTKPISPYGLTKLTLENYARLYAVTHGLRFVCVRPANAFGVGQRPFVGQGFISTAMASALRREPIKIFGEAGTIRDYLYVTDLASGLVCALEKGHLSSTYNLGSGVGISNLDVIHAMSPLVKNLGYDIRVEHLPKRSFDVNTNILDCTRLQTDTSWRPRISFLEGLTCTFDWLRVKQDEG